MAESGLPIPDTASDVCQCVFPPVRSAIIVLPSARSGVPLPSSQMPRAPDESELHVAPLREEQCVAVAGAAYSASANGDAGHELDLRGIRSVRHAKLDWGVHGA
ncbi:hypothetical protein AURDEDRAFT_112337 [Auricularia subglabra TFB-10046 SS5]|nr:hypothetical protein AURDEDRAFT_112337 [Auricularia subglabra TFB-10046 SS5]